MDVEDQSDAPVSDHTLPLDGVTPVDDVGSTDREDRRRALEWLEATEARLARIGDLGDDSAVSAAVDATEPFSPTESTGTTSEALRTTTPGGTALDGTAADDTGTAPRATAREDTAVADAAPDVIGVDARPVRPDPPRNPFAPADASPNRRARFDAIMNDDLDDLRSRGFIDTGIIADGAVSPAEAGEFDWFEQIWGPAGSGDAAGAPVDPEADRSTSGSTVTVQSSPVQSDPVQSSPIESDPVESSRVEPALVEPDTAEAPGLESRVEDESSVRAAAVPDLDLPPQRQGAEAPDRGPGPVGLVEGATAVPAGVDVDLGGPAFADPPIAERAIADPIDAGPVDAGPVDAGPLAEGPVLAERHEVSWDDGASIESPDRRRRLITVWAPMACFAVSALLAVGAVLVALGSHPGWLFSMVRPLAQLFVLGLGDGSKPASLLVAWVVGSLVWLVAALVIPYVADRRDYRANV